MKLDVLNRLTGEVQFTAEIDCAANALPSIKLGLAVKWALKTDAKKRHNDAKPEMPGHATPDSGAGAK